MKSTIFLLLGLFSLSVHAQLTSCSAEGGGDYRCYRKQRLAISKDLQKVESQLQKLDAQLNAKNFVSRFVAKRFKTSQQLWLKFAEADCRMESEGFLMAQGAGATRVYEECMAEMYDRRKTQMEKIIRGMQEERDQK